MRLSDVKGGRVLDVVADLIGPISSIARDEAVRGLLRPEGGQKGKDAREEVSRRLTEALPGILKDHKTDVIAILATVKGVPPSEYEEGMTLASLLADAVDLITDEVFADFLAAQTGTSSPSA